MIETCLGCAWVREVAGANEAEARPAIATRRANMRTKDFIFR